MKKILVIWFYFLTLIGVAVLAAENEKPSAMSAAKRPSTWAAKMEKPGLPNLHCLNTNFYRGAQPTREGMTNLQAMGIKTIINLRGFHSDKKKVRGIELGAERLHFNTWHAEDEDVIQFLKLVTNTNNYPIFVHCQHGADRTGLMCAMYRMVVCGWPKEEAIKEMTQGGFGFHSEWQNLIRYLRRVDVENLKQRAGIRTDAVNGKQKEDGEKHHPPR